MAIERFYIPALCNWMICLILLIAVIAPAFLYLLKVIDLNRKSKSCIRESERVCSEILAI